MSNASPALSLIIPVYSSQKTLFECLESCKKALQLISPIATELIIVDDASVDISAAIAQEFCEENSPVLEHCEMLFIRHKENRGPIEARHNGVEASSADLLVFLDSDVIIGEDVLAQVLDYFGKHDEVAAISANPQDRSSGSFASRYKSSYMRFILGQWEHSANFLYGSFFAMRRSAYRRVDSVYRGIEDDALGKALSDEGQKINILHDLDILHLKEYSYRSLLINDFKVSRSYAFLFYDTQGWKKVWGSGFSHAPRSQIISLFLASTSLLLLLLLLGGVSAQSKTLSLSLVFSLLLWLSLNLTFLNELRVKHGIRFSLASLPHTYFDHLVMTMGIASGFISRLTMSNGDFNR
jgi:glycosyltransferase involved in cell wall biosynthesis